LLLLLPDTGARITEAPDGCVRMSFKPFIPQIDIPAEGAAARSGWIGELGAT
jgi:hypothetical protein